MTLDKDSEKLDHFLTPLPDLLEDSKTVSTKLRLRVNGVGMRERDLNTKVVKMLI